MDALLAGFCCFRLCPTAAGLDTQPERPETTLVPGGRDIVFNVPSRPCSRPLLCSGVFVCTSVRPIRGLTA